jgi:hypothetical protein
MSSRTRQEGDACSAGPSDTRFSDNITFPPPCRTDPTPLPAANTANGAPGIPDFRPAATEIERDGPVAPALVSPSDTRFGEDITIRNKSNWTSVFVFCFVAIFGATAWRAFLAAPVRCAPEAVIVGRRTAIEQCATTTLLDSCEWYECLDAALGGCGAHGYPLGYGSVYCRRFASTAADAVATATSPRELTAARAFDQWQSRTGQCLRQEGAKVAASDAVLFAATTRKACARFARGAFASHPACYVGSGLCPLVPTQLFKLLDTIGLQTLLQFQTVRQVVVTVGLCSEELLSDAFGGDSDRAGGGIAVVAANETPHIVDVHDLDRHEAPPFGHDIVGAARTVEIPRMAVLHPAATGGDASSPAARPAVIPPRRLGFIHREWAGADADAADAQEHAEL